MKSCLLKDGRPRAGATALYLVHKTEIEDYQAFLILKISSNTCYVLLIIIFAPTVTSVFPDAPLSGPPTFERVLTTVEQLDLMGDLHGCGRRFAVLRYGFVPLSPA